MCLYQELITEMSVRLKLKEEAAADSARAKKQ